LNVAIDFSCGIAGVTFETRKEGLGLLLAKRHVARMMKPTSRPVESGGSGVGSAAPMRSGNKRKAKVDAATRSAKRAKKSK
jgi:hypothetical protein